MRRIDCPLWTLCLVLLATGVLAFGLGLFMRLGMGVGTLDDTTQSKTLAVQALGTAFDLLKAPSQPPETRQFSVPRPFSSATEAVGFTMQPLQPSTYLVRSDDHSILMLLQQQPDGSAKQCLIHPPAIQVGICQLGANAVQKK
ncbi:MAG: hypothetical protein HEQ39_08425 [Rhizobacter sp.]